MDINDIKNVVTLDYETYYDNNFTLKKLNYTDYIKSDEFVIHGVGIKINSKPTKWYTYEDVQPALDAIDWSTSALLAQNTYFDGFILYYRNNIVPAGYLDSKLMATCMLGKTHSVSLKSLAKLFGLPEKIEGTLSQTMGIKRLDKHTLKELGEYCVRDVDICRQLYDLMLPYIPEQEMQLQNMTLRMFCDPVLILNTDLLESSVQKVIDEKREALEKLGVKKELLTSRDKFATLLREAGVEPPTKISATTGKPTLAFSKTDLDFLALKEHENKRVRDLVTTRLLCASSLAETRPQRFIDAAVGDGKLPIFLNYYGAHTMRWSGGNKMNAQNLTRGSDLRKALEAPDGYLVMAADLSQIEPRVLAWMSDHEELLQAFRQADTTGGPGVYELQASKVYGADPNNCSFIERFVGKVCTLGLGYGMGAAKLQHTLAAGQFGDPLYLSFAECKNIVDSYRLANSSITNLWKRLDRYLWSMYSGTTLEYKGLSFFETGVKLPNDCVLHYYLQFDERTEQLAFKTTRGTRKIYGGLFVENIVQALARAIIAEQMVEVEKHYRVVTTSHDEIVCIVPENEEAKASEIITSIMTAPISWAPDLPLNMEIDCAKYYSK